MKLLPILLLLLIASCTTPTEAPIGEAEFASKRDAGTTVLRVQGDTTVVNRADGKPVDGLVSFRAVEGGDVILRFQIVEY